MKIFVYNAGALYSWLTNGARQMLATRFEASLSVCCCWHELHQLNSSRQINLGFGWLPILRHSIAHCTT